MKVYISADMEGVAGIVDWAQCIAGGDDYALGRDLLLGEVNAAIAGARNAGATEILVNDSHSVMRNLPPAALAGQARYLSGRFKPWYMMEGLDASYQAIVFLGYHAPAGTAGVLSHTYNPRAVAGVRLHGTLVGEAALNALVAQSFGVPIAVVTGDQFAGEDLTPYCPGLVRIEVKRSISRYAAEHEHPVRAREIIESQVGGALSTLDRLAAPAIPLPATLEVEFVTADMAEQATWVRGVSRLDARSVSLTDEDPRRLFQTFITLVYLTRPLAELG